MKVLRNISRIFVGFVFVFSGFVKGVDPIGTAYRIDDYLIAYGIEWALPLSLILSVFLCTLEFLLGAILLFNVKIRFFSWILFPLMIFFTLLTFYDALYEPVPDCGCFGDAITLSNWGTFYKNIVLIFFVAIIFIKRKDYKSLWRKSSQNIFAIVFIILFSGFSLYNYYHLPVLDFRAWKVGNNMIPENTGEIKIYLTYKNVNTGESKEYLSPNYPWNDSVWMSEWEFLEQRIDDSEIVKGHELLIESEEGDDFTDSFIANPDYQLMVIAYNLDNTDPDDFEAINNLYEKSDSEGISMILITSSSLERVEEFRNTINPNIDIYYADDVVLKTMVRANPGLMLMKDGHVIAKWHYNDIPDYADIKKKYLKE